MSTFSHIVRKHQPKKFPGKPLTGKTGAMLVEYDGGYKAVLKLAQPTTPRGKSHLYGISVQSGPYREVAYYQLAKFLGWDDLVPECVMTRVKDIDVSAAVFVPALQLPDINKDLVKYAGDHERWQVHFRETLREFQERDLIRLVIMDIIAGARDRHGTNLGARLELQGGKPVYKLVGWDNAATFAETFARYHQVIHKYNYRFSLDLEPYWKKLQNIRYAEFRDAIDHVPTEVERQHAWLRLQFILEFPHLLPFETFSEGIDYAPEFPSYSSYFTDLCKPEGTPGSLFILNRSRLSG